MTTNEVISFSFCQVSDLNLDSSSALNLHLSPSQRKQRSDESIEALAAAMKAASSNDVNAVLIPGNLFDADDVTTTTLESVQKIFARLGEIPVFIAPGAHDPLFNDSLFDESVLRARGLKPWSENVHIFGADSVRSVSLPDKESIRISGVGLTKKNRQTTPYVEELPESDRVAINVLLLPLGLDEAKLQEADTELAKKLESRAYSYVAVSGFENEHIFKNAEGVIFSGAAGTFIGQTAGELGPRKAIFANLDKRIGSGMDLTIHSEEFDPRRIINVNFDLSQKEPELMPLDFAAAIKKSGARKEKDILLVTLDGFYPVGAEIQLVDQNMRDEYFHLRVIDKTRPNYLETLSDKNIIESKYVGILAELKIEAKMEGESDNSEKLAIITDALYFGLEAIREGKVSIRDAD